MEVKRKLVTAINAFLEPFRERRAHYASRPGLIDEILHAGSERARREADETLRLAREAMGLNYFRAAATVRQRKPRTFRSGASWLNLRGRVSELEVMAE